MNIIRSLFLLFIFLVSIPTIVFSKDILIEQILSEYNANEARFHVNWRGRSLSGNGTVMGIKADLLGTGKVFYVEINVNGSIIICNTYNKNAAASLNKGSVVKFSGQVDDVMFSSLTVSDCTFSEAMVDFNSQLNMIVSKIQNTCPVRIKESALGQLFWDEKNSILVYYQRLAPTSGFIDWVNIRNKTQGRTWRYEYKTNQPGDTIESQGMDLRVFSYDEEIFKCKFNSILKIGDESKKDEVVECRVKKNKFLCSWK